MHTFLGPAIYSRSHKHFEDVHFIFSYFCSILQMLSNQDGNYRNYNYSY